MDDLNLTYLRNTRDRRYNAIDQFHIHRLPQGSFCFFLFFEKTLSIILIIKYKSNKSKYTLINNLLG